MSDLIKLVGGLEKSKKILGKAKEYNTGINIHSMRYFGGDKFCQGDILLADLRKEIADHDRTDTCVDISNHISPSTRIIEK